MMRTSLLSGLWADIRCVVRRLGGRRVYFAAVVATLALAMGAAIAVFDLVDGLVLHPLKLPRVEEVVTLQRRYTREGVEQRRTTLSWPQLNRLRPIQSLAGMAVSTNQDDKLSAHSTVTMPDGHATQPALRFVSWNYFDVLQVGMDRGRSLSQLDDTVGAPVVAVASHRWWAREFAGAARLGQVVRINNVPVTIVGVLSAGFEGLELGSAQPALYLPLNSAPAVGQDSAAAGDTERRLAGDSGIASMPSVFPAAAFQILVRLPAGRAALLAEARTRLRSDEWAVVPVTETMLPFEHVEDARMFVRVLVGAVCITVAVACLNVAVLMFAGGQERAREYSIRSMLGAAPSVVARVVAVESVAIACCAGLGAGAVAWAVRHVAIALALPGTAWVESSTPQPLRAALFTVLLTLLVAALIAALPVRQVIRRGPDPARGSTATGAQLKTLSVLVALQAAACVVMALAAALFLRAVHLRLSQDLGFRDQGLLTAEVALGADQRNESALEYADQMLRDVRGLPGIRGAASGPAPLLTGSDWSTSDFVVDGTPRTTDAPVDMVYAGDDYFKTLGQLGVRGRDFEEGDTATAPLVVMVNAAAARLFWPGTDAIAHKLLLRMFKAPLLARDMYVIAVVPDATLRRLGDPVRPTIYLSRLQFHDYLAGFATQGGTVNLLIRSDADVPTLTPQLSATVRAHGQELLSLVSVAETRREMVQPQLLVGALLVFLGGTIGVVTVIGAYATGYVTALRQRRAHAIRIALGAIPSDVVWATVWDSSRVLVVGVCGGLFAAWALKPFVEGVALGTRLFDPLALAVITVVVCGSGVLAVYLPLRRIGDIDPSILLKD